MTDRETRLRERIDELTDQRDIAIAQRDVARYKRMRATTRLSQARASRDAWRQKYETVRNHGTRASYASGCHCELCRVANALYLRDHRTTKAGTGKPQSGAVAGARRKDSLDV